MILVGDSLKTLFPQVDLTRLKFIAFLVIAPITWMPIHLISYASMLGIIASISLAVVILIDGFTKPEPLGSLLKPMDTHLFPSNWITLPLAFGLINVGFTGHYAFPSLYCDMEKPGSYNRVINYSYLIASIIYITVAVSGYLMFGSETLKEVKQISLGNQKKNKIFLFPFFLYIFIYSIFYR